MTTMKTTRTTTISDLSIRAGSVSDLNEIQEIEIRAFGVHAYSPEEIRNMLESSITYICEINGKAVGYASAYFTNVGKVGHIESIAVHPEFQGMGIGKKLMVAIESEAGRRGCYKVILETFEKNEKAIRLYLKMGYRIKRILKGYYSIPYEGSVDAIRMEKDIKVK
ncbi:MAG: GNAT family N-acetyltransferase [Thermoplasmatales archaeon]